MPGSCRRNYYATDARYSLRWQSVGESSEIYEFESEIRKLAASIPEAETPVYSW